MSLMSRTKPDLLKKIEINYYFPALQYYTSLYLNPVARVTFDICSFIIYLIFIFLVVFIMFKRYGVLE